MRTYQNYYVKVQGEWRLVIIGIDGNKGIIDKDVASVPEFLTEYWIKNNMISVTEVKIDESDIERLRNIQWLRAAHGYIRGKNLQSDNAMVFLHRYLMNPPEDKVIDHINGDKLDNRRCNLRIATYMQNSHNKESINIRKMPNDKFNVYFKVNGEQRSFGTFSTYEEAVKRRAIVKHQLAFGTLTETPEVQSSTGEKYVKRYRNGFSVVIQSGSTRKYLGNFDTIDEAVKVRDAALGKTHNK